MERGRLEVLDVHADLHVSRLREVEAERADAWEAAVVALADDACDLARGLDGAAEIDVEGDQGTPSTDDHSSRALVEPRRTEVGGKLPTIQPALQLAGTAAPEERRPPPRREIRVQKHGQRELVADAPGELERSGARPRAIFGPQWDEGNNVRGADPRVRSFVASEVDPLTCTRDPREQRVDQLALVSDERENRTVVVDIRVDVEQLRVCGECVRDRVDRLPVPTLREVRHGFERQPHRAYSRSHGGETLRRRRARRHALQVTRRRSSYRSLTSLQRDLAVCRACIEAGYPLESLPVRNPHLGQSAYIFGQAPGPVEGEARRPWRGRAGQTLRRWLRMEEEEFYSTFYCASVTRCYPGKAATGKGDRVPTPHEQDLCEFWRDWELELIRPKLIVPVGGLAIKRLLGRSGLSECVGVRFEFGDAAAVPLPHPSGVSVWLNSRENRALVERAVDLIHAELGAIGERL